MRVILLMFFVSLGLTIHAQQAPKASDFKKLHWLEGTWTWTNSKPGRSTIETWKKISDTEWQGTSINMKGADTTLVEKIKIIIKEGKIYYVADVPENKKPIYFEFIELTDNHFVCANPTHDFPKKLDYTAQGKSLKAVISGDGNSIEYLFSKQ
jgi:hypothetical protein